MTKTGPDVERFRSTVGSTVLDARRRTGSVHAYGEMVGVLAAQGDLVAALALEDLWSRLIDQHPFRLLCGYPRDIIGDAGSAFDGICAAHHALLVAREPSEPTLNATVDLPLGPGAAATARRAAREVLCAWGFADAAALADASVVVSELVTAAGRQGARRVRLGLGLDGEHVVVSVTGVVPAPHPPTEGELTESGRLFSVLSALTQSWGVQSLPDTTRLWARVPTQPGPELSGI